MHLALQVLERLALTQKPIQMVLILIVPRSLDTIHILQIAHSIMCACLVELCWKVVRVVWCTAMSYRHAIGHVMLDAKCRTQGHPHPLHIVIFRKEELCNNHNLNPSHTSDSRRQQVNLQLLNNITVNHHNLFKCRIQFRLFHHLRSSAGSHQIQWSHPEDNQNKSSSHRRILRR